MIALGVVLLVAGVRWAVLAKFGNDVPYWDEWRADAANLFKPWLQGNLTWSALFGLHNEHRIVLTRFWELGFFMLNAHRWDPLLVQTANALLAAATAGLVVLQAGSVLPRQRGWVLGGALCALVVPFAYSNLLIAFQSQFIFFSLLTVAAFGLWSAPRIGAAKLLGGALCAAGALVTVGSGILVAVTLAFVAAWRFGREPARRPFWLVGFASAVALVALGVALSPAAEELARGSALFRASGRYLAWPAGNFITLATDWPSSARYFPALAATWPSAESAWLPRFAAFAGGHAVFETCVYWLLGLALYGPGLCLLGRALRGGRGVASPFVPALILWGLFNLGIMILARPNEPFVPPRYQDILILGLLANGLAWPLLLAPESGTGVVARSHRRWWPRWLAVGWLGLVLGCLALTAYGIFGVQLPRKRAENHAAARLIQRYLLSGDARIFVGQPPNHVPWPKHEADLANLLRDPAVCEFLPRGVLPEANRPEAPMLSRAAGVIRAAGWMVAGLGALVIAVGWSREARR